MSPAHKSHRPLVGALALGSLAPSCAAFCPQGPRAHCRHCCRLARTRPAASPPGACQPQGTADSRPVAHPGSCRARWACAPLCASLAPRRARCLPHSPAAPWRTRPAATGATGQQLHAAPGARASRPDRGTQPGPIQPRSRAPPRTRPAGLARPRLSAQLVTSRARPEMGRGHHPDQSHAIAQPGPPAPEAIEEM